MLIIGLDGLEYEFVVRWRCKKFMQKVYGKYDIVGISRLSTPILWGSILTGINVEKHGYDIKAMDEKKGRVDIHKNILVRFLYDKFYKYRAKLPVKDLGIRRFLTRINEMRNYPGATMPVKLLKQTFLYKLQRRGYKVLAIEVPSYNETLNDIFRANCPKFMLAPHEAKLGFIQLLLKECKRRVNIVLNSLDEYDLIFVYLPIPDLIHHVLSLTRHLKFWIFKYYKDIERLISPLLKYDDLTLILSDHGFSLKTLDHTNYGFWSLNEDLGWDVKTIYDFHKHILSYFKVIN